MHPPAPHQVLRTVLLLVLEVVPVIVHLLLEEMEGVPAESLADQLYLHLVSAVELHEEPHGPKVVALVVQLCSLSVQCILKY